MHSPFFFLKYFLKFLIALRVDYTSNKGNYKNINKFIKEYGLFYYNDV